MILVASIRVRTKSANSHSGLFLQLYCNSFKYRHLMANIPRTQSLGWYMRLHTLKNLIYASYCSPTPFFTRFKNSAHNSLYLPVNLITMSSSAILYLLIMNFISSNSFTPLWEQIW